MAHLKPHQRRGIIVLGLVITLTLAALSPLWLPVARNARYYVLVPEGFTGPVALVYPVPDGVSAYQQGTDPTQYYDLPPGVSYLLVKDSPPSGAQIAFAITDPNGQIRPLNFYSSGYGGNDLYFVETFGLEKFTLKTTDNKPVAFNRVRFAIYDRRTPGTVEDMDFNTGRGVFVSQQIDKALTKRLKALSNGGS